MTYWRGKVVLITGGSAGFGKVLARTAARAGARVAIAGRDAQRLAACTAELAQQGADVAGFAADVTEDEQVEALLAQTLERFGQLDMLVNNAGRSSRGDALDTTVAEFRELLELNFLATVRCSRAAAPHLIATRGHLVNIGSLASKTAARYLGAYPPSKFAVAAYSHQLRLELGPRGVHVLLVCPGPIERADAGQRYDDQAEDLPAAARLPGAGVRLKGIPPERLAALILRACRRRRRELVVPARARLLLAVAQLWPGLGDWILCKMTSAP